ncbi:DUF7507 domain-containing protein [Paenibacillus aceti]|uniref:DUF11 domain-containing protein n=1 Tax=Paenibacillus aceti TaxID=1820010 RepID=A0ABQ1VSH2_9BACL|nr:DUF11 domain-containing protein [Paenibacillus aceti]GGF95256.1 hypothetical protein GCM10010913_16060 [Paenibacillus aceti]
MPLNLRFVDNQQGAITFIGNTLGLSRSDTVGVPGTVDSIGAFTTVNTSLQFGSYPPGTTDDFNLNSSSAELRMPPGSNVLYAELVWSGVYTDPSGGNVSAFINDPINFTTPQGNTFSIAPDSSTATNLSLVTNTNVYIRSADVTSIVQNSGAGIYIAGGVPGLITFTTGTSNYCGWTLCVAYQNFGLPFRNLSIYVGGVVVSSNSTVSTPISGFGTPITGPISGRLAVTAADGDAIAVGDQTLFGPTTGSLTVLSGPNNLPNNFFASQINDDNGLLDTSGTFGTRNQINGSPGTNVVGGRQGWDITNVDISSTLVNNQTQAIVQFRTSNDIFVVTDFGLQIDLNAPLININKDVDAPVATLGQVLTYRIFFSNTGTSAADSATLTDFIPQGMDFIPDSVFLDGVHLPGVNPQDGIPVGTLNINEGHELTFQVKVGFPPPGGVFINEARLDFLYQIVAGGPFESGSVISNQVITPFLFAEIQLTKEVTPTSAVPGEVVHYRFTLFNPGPTPLHNIRLDDPTLGFHQDLFMLDPGTIAEYFLDFVIPPGTPAGTLFHNFVTAISDETPPVTAFADVNILASYNLRITKTPDRFVANPGETVNYTIQVDNLSNAPLTNIVVEDSLTGFSIVIPNLVINSEAFFTLQFTVPPGALAGSVITNVATATPAETGPVSAEAAVVVGEIPNLFVFKSVDHPTAAPGETVNYMIRITNTGNSALTNIHITDPMLGVDETFDALNPGETLQVDAPFIIPRTAMEGDIIHNVVTAVSDQAGPVTANADVIVTGNSAIEITKTASPTQASPGSPIMYSFVVTNTGNTTLSNVLLTDSTLGLSEVIGTMEPGESRTISTSFVIPAGAQTNFTNTATVTGNFGAIEVVDSDDAVVELLLPEFTLTKSVQPAEALPGEEVVFSYFLTNTGNVPLTNIALTDPLLSFTSTVESLAPGAAVGGSIPFTIPADALEGSAFTNVLTAAPQEAAAQSASATVTTLGAPAMELTKSADVSTAMPGDTVTYTVTVTNTGNSNLISVGVGDDTLGLDAVIPVLGVGQSETFVISTVIPLGTPDGTILTNTSTATSDQTESIEAIARVIVNVPPFTIDVNKSVSPTTALPGQTVQYTITVTNPSVGALTNVALSDDLLGITQPLGTLAPGETRTLTFNFTVPIDAPAGSELINTATATSDQSDPVATSTILSIAGTANLQLSKAFSPAEARPGQTVSVILTLHNTGNTNLTNIALNDPQLGFALVVPSLNAGATQTVTLPFIVPNLPEDTVIADTIVATSDQTGETTASSALTVLPPFRASLTKTVDHPNAAPGDTVTFTIEFRNLSGAPLTHLVCSDPLLEFMHTINEVPAGYFTTITRTVQIPPGTLGGTTLLNTVSFESPEIGRLEAEAGVTVASVPSLQLTKSVSPESALPGQTVLFSLRGVNTGNVTLHQIQFSDPLLGLQGIVATQIPGEVQSAFIPFTIPTTAVAGERIVNTLIVNAPGLPQQTATAVVNVTALPLTIIKEASAKEVFVEDTIHFTLKVTHTGSTPVTNIVLTDKLQEGIRFITGSVRIDGNPQPTSNMETGIALGNLTPGQTRIVTFKVQAVCVPPKRKVSNLAHATFQPQGSNQSFQVSSNVIEIKINEHEE